MNARKVIQLSDGYTAIASEAKYEGTKGERLTILTPKQMLQRLPIALVQVKKLVIHQKIY